MGGVADGSIPDEQIAAFLMAVYLVGMDAGETGALTDAMMRSGETLDLSGLPGPKVDKHSTGGIGDKTSLVVAPAAAAAGAVVPMISGRGLGHTGGTLDKLEAIPGLGTALPREDLLRQLSTVGAAVVAQTPELCPADRRLYALRGVTATVESVPLIAASIMSKKLAEGIDALLLDVKVGSGAFLRDVEEARTLAGAMVAVGSAAGKRVRAVLTDMSQPLGRAVGNALEVREALETLEGGGPADFAALCREVGGRMLLLAGLEADPGQAAARYDRAIASGAARERFGRMVAAQGGDPAALDDPAGLPRAAVVRAAAAARSGVVRAVDGVAVGMAAVRLGAGRLRKEDRVDPAVGFVFAARIGDEVRAGEPLAEVHARTDAAAEEAAGRVAAAVAIGDGPVGVPPLVRGEVG